jgi:hypothetical protein
MTELNEYPFGMNEGSVTGGIGGKKTRYSSGITKGQEEEYIPLGTNLKNTVYSTIQQLQARSQKDDLPAAALRDIGTVIQGVGKGYDWITEDLRNAATDPSRTGSGQALLGLGLMGIEEATRLGGKGSEMWATGADLQNPITEQPMGNLPRREDGQPHVDPDVARTAGEVLTGAAFDWGAGKGIQGLNKLTKSLKIADT